MEMLSGRQAETKDIAAYIYDKLCLVQSCNMEWTSPAARHYVVDGLYDPTHAAILSAQSFQDDLETFVRRAVLLQNTTGGRLDTHSQQEPTGSRLGCLTCGRFGHGYKTCHKCRAKPSSTKPGRFALLRSASTAAGRLQPSSILERSARPYLDSTPQPASSRVPNRP
ncbi:hypothetical protein HPB50_023963 [Hyalomma asiaticum]|uniref:Uncharacterized protein n=1 Tax=Hyalomma asiaticum TaxID=266040 RepID=A0ACB7S5Z1_HYAAI|nr:hypothetical protein HPB50_023963 [Hyalomma asiaticum]